MACTTSRTAVVRGWPPGVAAGMSGTKTVHAISVRSVVSRAPLRALPSRSPEGHHLTTQSTFQIGSALSHRISAALYRRKSLVYTLLHWWERRPRAGRPETLTIAMGHNGPQTPSRSPYESQRARASLIGRFPSRSTAAAPKTASVAKALAHPGLTSCTGWVKPRPPPCALTACVLPLHEAATLLCHGFSDTRPG
jgi:hypothetical protein